MVDIRDCEQCGASFVPRREHARFCCVCCRTAWNREHVGDPGDGESALLWSITAMTEATQRLARAGASSRPRAAAVIREAVWWVTIVDATMIRHHTLAYDDVLAGQAPAQRPLVEGTLTGLRFVRNQIGGRADPAEFLALGEHDRGAGGLGVAAWTWQPAPEPALASLSPRGRAWEMARYQAYQDHLVGRSMGETFDRAATFLRLAAANALAVTADSVHAAR